MHGCISSADQDEDKMLHKNRYTKGRRDMHEPRVIPVGDYARRLTAARAVKEKGSGHKHSIDFLAFESSLCEFQAAIFTIVRP